MAQVITPVSHSRKHICPKGAAHEGLPLDIVCLDPLCHSERLACAVCFTQFHKYHHVLGLDNLIDGYSRAASRFDNAVLYDKITHHYSLVKNLIATMKMQTAKAIQIFEENVDAYVDYLLSLTSRRNKLASSQNITLEQGKLRSSSREELAASVQFIVAQGLFQADGSAPDVSEIVRQNTSKAETLLDNMVNLTQDAHHQMVEALKAFDFPVNILKKEAGETRKHSIELLRRISSVVKPVRLQGSSQCIGCIKKPNTRETIVKCLYSHSALEVSQNRLTINSKASASVPQWAIVTAQLNKEPLSIQQWSVRINQCSPLACVDTVAVGMCDLSQMRKQAFEGREVKGVLMVSSQGVVHSLTDVYQSTLRFGAGDVLHFKYDPNYHLLEIKRQNGPKITLSTLSDNVVLHGVVRLTYNPDEVELV